MSHDDQSRGVLTAFAAWQGWRMMSSSGIETGSEMSRHFRFFNKNDIDQGQSGYHGSMTVNCAGTATLTIPAHMHISMQLLARAGIPPIRTVGAPGVQGAGVAGTHGIGVRTPKAAAVAAATVGLAGLEHMPNGMMFAIGTLSMILAAGAPPAMTRATGKTCNAAGAAPKLH